LAHVRTNTEFEMLVQSFLDKKIQESGTEPTNAKSIVNIDVYKAHRHEDVLKLFLLAQNIDLSIPQSGMIIE
jgi:hypothetical protein